MRPVVSALKQKYQEQVEFIVVDVATADGLALARQYGVSATPTYLFLTADGFTMGSLRGRQDAATMEAAVETLLETSERMLDPEEELAAARLDGQPVLLSFVLPG